MVPSEGWGGDPAERGESTSVSRCARSDGICPTRRHPDDEARPAAHTPAARTAGEGGSRRRVVPGEMRGKGAPADGVQEAAPTCGCHIERYRYHDTVPRRPVSVADDAEGTSAPGAEEAVRTCGHYTDTAPRRPTPSTVLGFKRGLQNKCDEMRVEVSRGGVPTDGFQESVARCGFRNPSLVRRCPMPPGRDTTRCAQMGAASSCVPVPTGARGGGGGRGHRDTHDDYAGTSRSRAAQLHAPTADLPAEMYDTGSIVGPSGSSTVNNVQVFAGYVLHIGSFMEGPDSKALSVGDEVKCKEVLGDLIDQKGSIVLPEKLRFDFSHGKPVQPEDLRKNESIVKQQIEAELEVSAQEIKLAEAKHINGLRAVFGEIYPDPVRVVSIGRKVEDVLANPESKEWLSISTELCGGTHFSNTRDAAAFALISEEDIAKGVRRITAVTAECASQAMKLASSIETDINEASKLDGATLEKVSLGGVNGNSTCRRTLINRVPSAVTGLNGSLSCGRVASASSFSSCAASIAKGGKSESFAASGLDYTDIPNAQIRKVTANRHLASKQTISHYYLTVDTCGDKLIKLRGELNPLQEASGGKKISINDLVVKGNIARWLKKEGDKVSLGGILCEAETEKVTAEMECMEEGYLAKIVQGDGAKEIKVEEHVLSVKMDINGENEISWEKEASEPSDFICSDRGGCYGSKKGKLNYISKMNYYLRADCVSDIKAISDREARNRHSRYEVLKERCCDLAEMPALLSTCASIKISGADIVTQIFMDICGSTISLQKNLRKLDINLLSEAAFVKAGIKPRDFYSTYAGKVLEPNRLLSCYQIPRDSTIKLNTRLRGGCASYETWDDIIRAQQLYETVLLPPEHLVLPHPGGSAMQGTVLVKYLAEHMQFRSRKVLIQLCRKHYSGTSYGGNITSKNILFDPDGNVRINSAPETFSEHSAKSDYVAIGTILEDSFKDHVKNCYPMHLYQLVDFLRYGPVVDYKSEAVIAFVTNHPSLLSHFERIQISESLVQLIDRLHPAVVTVLLASLDQFVWRHTVKKVPAMKHTYTFHSWRNKAGKLCVPYADNGVSFLKFSNNFFKHHDWASLEQLDAAFSLVMEIKNFIPRCLFTILVTLKNSQNQYPALIQSFIDQVVRMLGNNVIDLKSRVMPV